MPILDAIPKKTGSLGFGYFIVIVWFTGFIWQIYIAPSKALVQEKLRDWNMKLGPLAINCLEMTGDSEFYDNKAIHDADLILTTPEVHVTTYFHLQKLR